MSLNSKMIRYITSDCDAVSIIRDVQGYAKTPEDAVGDVLKAGNVGPSLVFFHFVYFPMTCHMCLFLSFLVLFCCVMSNLPLLGCTFCAHYLLILGQGPFVDMWAHPLDQTLWAFA